MLIRPADAARDAAACAAIYAPSVTHGVASLEAVAPDTAGLSRRIDEVPARCPWLVAELDAEIAGFGVHESLGFRPIGVDRQIGYTFGAWRDVGWWQKTLQEPVPRHTAGRTEP